MVTATLGAFYPASGDLRQTDPVPEERIDLRDRLFVGESGSAQDSLAARHDRDPPEHLGEELAAVATTAREGSQGA